MYANITFTQVAVTSAPYIKIQSVFSVKKIHSCA